MSLMFILCIGHIDLQSITIKKYMSKFKAFIINLTPIWPNEPGLNFGHLLDKKQPFLGWPKSRVSLLFYSTWSVLVQLCESHEALKNKKGKYVFTVLFRTLNILGYSNRGERKL